MSSSSDFLSLAKRVGIVDTVAAEYAASVFNAERLDSRPRALLDRMLEQRDDLHCDWPEDQTWLQYLESKLLTLGFTSEMTTRICHMHRDSVQQTTPNLLMHVLNHLENEE